MTKATWLRVKLRQAIEYPNAITIDSLVKELDRYIDQRIKEAASAKSHNTKR